MHDHDSDQWYITHVLSFPGGSVQSSEPALIAQRYNDYS